MVTGKTTRYDAHLVRHNNECGVSCRPGPRHRHALPRPRLHLDVELDQDLGIARADDVEVVLRRVRAGRRPQRLLRSGPGAARLSQSASQGHRVAYAELDSKERGLKAEGCDVAGAGPGPHHGRSAQAQSGGRRPGP